MALIKRRPKVQVLVPRLLHPGQNFEAVFELDVTRPVPIEHFDVELRGRTRVAVGDQGYADAGVPLHLRARLSGPRELQPGTLRFPCRFSLPPSAPPTFHGRIVRVSYVLRAEIAIPWWVDVERTFELTLAPTPYGGGRSPKPLLYSSAPDGPAEREPHAEVSLADGVVQPGEVLRGAVALGNVAFARYTGIRITLTGWEYAHGMERQGEFGGWQIEVPVSEAREGEPIAFDLRVPEVPPSFSSDAFRVWWTLDVTVTRRLAGDLVVSLPIVILPRAGGAEEERAARLTRAPPTVGNARVQRVWSDVATRAGMRLEGERLRARVGAVDVALYRDSAEGRPRLVAELGFPSLGLDLQSGSGGVLSRLWSKEGVVMRDGTVLTGRDETQVRALVALVDPALRFVEVRRFDDDRLALERAGAGLTLEPVLDLARVALELARRVPEIARSLPAPAGIELAPWQEVARALSGELRPARPSVTGELGGRRVELTQLWAPGAAASGVEIAVLASSPIPERFHAGVGSFTGEARAIADEWVDQDAELAVRADRITLVMPGVLTEAEPVLALAESLAKLADALGRRGAYR